MQISENHSTAVLRTLFYTVLPMMVLVSLALPHPSIAFAPNGYSHCVWTLRFVTSFVAVPLSPHPRFVLLVYLCYSLTCTLSRWPLSVETFASQQVVPLVWSLQTYWGKWRNAHFHCIALLLCVCAGAKRLMSSSEMWRGQYSVRAVVCRFSGLVVA